MEIVNWELPLTSGLCSSLIAALAEKYPFIQSQVIGRSVFQTPVSAVTLGTGSRKVIFTAAHHANEWITAPVLLKFAEDQAAGYEKDPDNPQNLLNRVTMYLVPLVNPDGVDLVTGGIPKDSPRYEIAKEIGEKYPGIPFPQGWKANLLGTDLNLNYPAGWETAREIKASLGFDSPAPRDFVGYSPFDQAETQALSYFTIQKDPALVVALHSQGGEIYWQYGDISVPGARELGEEMAQVSGYRLADPAFNSSFAGYKDWFIEKFRRPGYTVEVGKGRNPLPLSQLPEIYSACSPLLLTAALGLPS